MYLSCLLIDVGDNPDRPRPGRLWLRNLYHVHQRLCMAFPSDSRKNDDELFLKPFKPEDFGNGQVHVPRRIESGFLFRIDPETGGRVVILVQSAVKPDWDYAFKNADYLLAAPPELKQYEPCFTKGNKLRYRLVVNPTKRLSKNSRERDGKLVSERWIGKRIPVPAEQLFDWLDHRAENAGFSIDRESTIVQPGYMYVKKPDNNNGQRLRSVRYDGILTVTDPVRFHETIISGIGPGKAFGFGLLSVSPVIQTIPESTL